MGSESPWISLKLEQSGGERHNEPLDRHFVLLYTINKLAVNAQKCYFTATYRSDYMVMQAPKWV